MKNLRIFGKLLALFGLVALAAVLTGCNTTPDVAASFNPQFPPAGPTVYNDPNLQQTGHPYSTTYPTY